MTPWFSQIVGGTVASIADCCYVEIGVETGQTIRHVALGAKAVHGCDIADCEAAMPAGSTFWHMPSDRFFAEYDGAPADVVFIDGEHTYEQARRDYQGACRILKPGGIVFLHDTSPGSDEFTTPEFCGDVYRLREELEQLPVAGFSWRAFPGLTMIAPPRCSAEAH